MFKENREVLKKITVFVDAVIIGLCFLAAYYLREWIGSNNIFPAIKYLKEAPVSLSRYFPLLVMAVLLWISGMYFNGMYGESRTKSLRKICGIVLRAAFYFLVGFGVLIFLFDFRFVGRLIIIIFMIFVFFAVVVEKIAIYSGLQYFRKKDFNRRRLSMRPGLTGLWQVKGRNKIDFNNWMKLDLEYLDNWSLWLDIKILAKTIPVILFGRGAY